MTITPGIDVLIKIGDGGDPENFAALGGLRLARLRVNNRPAEGADLALGAWRKLLSASGVRSLALSCEGAAGDSESEDLALAHALAATAVNCEFHFGGAEKISGPFVIAGYERGGGIDGESVYAMTFESAGAIALS